MLVKNLFVLFHFLVNSRPRQCFVLKVQNCLKLHISPAEDILWLMVQVSFCKYENLL
jgi:hypothetical protein